MKMRALMCTFARWGFALLLVVLMLPAIAYADESRASGSPCALTPEMRAQYEADGTLDERMAYMESLGNDQADAGLRMLSLAQDEASRSALQVPEGSKGGMATEGVAYVFVLHVDFPDVKFGEGDTLAATRALFDGSSMAAYPYENLKAYYDRSSYGKLAINVGDARAYTAQHNRDYYDYNEEELFLEALEHFDDEVDFSQFDGNGDGFIDAVYIHFAGTDTGWGSTWWSNQAAVSEESQAIKFDDVSMKNRVLLHYPSNTELAVRTAIHETGHVLGLPDYYNFGGIASSSGILTFDMMMDNLGDHCGFSKWMLGWLPEEKITHIVVNGEGMSIRKESEATAVPYDGGEVSLSAFTSDNLRDTGGIITIANQDDGIFSSYYVLQYDNFAGNQSVCYLDADYQPTPLSSGFRLYRVQAGLNDNGDDFAMKNMGGSVHHQLIELVDPDADEYHMGSSANHEIYCVPGTGRFGCMWYAGDSVSPTSAPVTTNFYENINVGFTGITLDFTKSESTEGALRVSYAADDKPVLGEFFIEPNFENVTNFETLSFTMSTQGEVAGTSGSYLTPYLEIDGKVREINSGDFSVSGKSIEVALLLDPGFVTSENKFEIVFPQGMFIVGRGADGLIYSEEIRIPLAYESAVKETGALDSLEFSGDAPLLSDLLVTKDGASRFFQVDGGSLLLHTMASGDLSQVEDSWEVASGVKATKLRYATELSDGSLFVCLFDQDAYRSVCYWVDPVMHEVVAVHELAGTIEQSRELIALDDAVLGIGAEYITDDAIPYLYVMLDPQDDGTVSEHYALAPCDTFCGVNEDMIALYDVIYDADADYAPAIVGIDVYDSEVLATLLRQAPDNITEGLSYQINASDALLASFDDRLAGYGDLRMAFADETFVAFAFDRPSSTALLVRLDGQGKEIARKELVMPSCMNVILRGANYGSVAVVYEDTIEERENCLSYRANFYDYSFNEASSVVMAGAGVGSWLDNGAWLSVGFGVQDYVPGAAGSPDMTAEVVTISDHALRYALTDVIDVERVAPPVSQDPEQGTDQDSGSDGTGSQSNSALASTGDSANALFWVTLAVVAAMILVWSALRFAKRS